MRGNFVIGEIVDHQFRQRAGLARRGLIDTSLVEAREFLFEIVEFLIAKAVHQCTAEFLLDKAE